MLRLSYDGSFAGLLTAVFEIYEFKPAAFTVSIGVSQPDLFGKEHIVITDFAKALRVWNGLKLRISKGALTDVYACSLSEVKGIENSIVRYIQLAFRLDNAEKAFSDFSVLHVSKVAKMVYRERHRMEAFVRFKLTADNIYFASIEPDFNVLPLLVSHFRKRYADQRWLIYDNKREYGIFYNLFEVEEVSFKSKEGPLNEKSNFAEEEALYQKLWKDYFKHVNIPSRKNTKLHVQHVPKRYWKYLVEKEDELEWGC